MKNAAIAAIFAVAVAAAFAVGWLTGSHAGYTAGAESEHVLIDARATLPEPAPPVAIVEPIRSTQPASGTWRTIALPGVDGSDTEAAWTTALAAHLGGEAEQEIGGVVAGRVDVLTDTQAIELDWLKGNKFHEGIGQALHYGDVTGQQPVLALISAYYNIPCFKVADRDDLLATLTRLKSDRDACQAMGARARDVAVSEFASPEMSEMYAQFFASL